MVKKEQEAEKKILINGKVDFQFYKLAEELRKYPKNAVASSLRVLGAAWNRWAEEYDETIKGGAREP